MSVDSERIVGMLEDARRLLEPPLPPSARFALVNFSEAVARGDLERAWDELAGVGAETSLPRAFWQILAEAASLLGLDEREAEARAKLR
jgi:predicted Zn-dependent protease